MRANCRVSGFFPYSPSIKNASTWKHLHHPSIQYAYPCRAQKHTPHKHPARDECIDLKSENVHLFSLGTTGRRMQYAPTQAHLYQLSNKYAYPCRAQKHTPHKYSARDECIDLKSENVHLFSLGMIGESMLQTHIKRRKM